ncbi:MAG: hypothetical protein A2157_15905 [Deltaproteobacteria bacterium RBG_16_47_11]|nr:MAG: hypothetical protein A2157_15905 [Deltaproteobacteria bacterium RBG_16_47_11]
MKIRKGLYLPERIVFVIIFFILIIFGVQLSKAQPHFSPYNKPTSRSDGQGAYWKSSDLGLTETQRKTLESLQRAYASEAFPLRMELMSLRFELRHLIRDSNIPSMTLLERQRKISELQGKLENLSLSYQIKARSIFTEKQLEQLPPDFSMGMGTGFGIELGKGPRSGLRQQGK